MRVSEHRETCGAETTWPALGHRRDRASRLSVGPEKSKEKASPLRLALSYRDIEAGTKKSQHALALSVVSGGI
jgi:hypothetical protein